MNVNPKISSITYVKDGEKYIRKCIESIMKQTLQNIEIIIVDGGSTDKTVEIIDELKNKDQRIVFLHVEGSVGAQFNAALKIARGEYIAVCEGDDYILNDKYEKLYEIASKYDLDVIRACYYLFFEHEGREYRYKTEIASPALYNLVLENDFENQFFLSTFVNGYWNGLYSRDFLISNDIRQNETRGASFQDITFSFLSQMYACRFLFIQEPYHCYRIDNSESSVNSKQCIEKITHEYDLLRKELKKRKIWDKYEQMFLVWEMNSYKQFLDKFSQDDKENLLDDLYERLINQNVPNKFGNLSIYSKTKKLIDALYVSKDAFAEAMVKNDEYKNKAFNFFKSAAFGQSKKFILFGMGHFGTIVYDFLNLSGKGIDIVDNSLQLQKTGFRNQKVYGVDYCMESDLPIIIANVEHAMDMTDQLRNMGVEESRIFTCEYEDLFIREIFMKSGLFTTVGVSR